MTTESIQKAKEVLSSQKLQAKTKMSMESHKLEPAIIAKAHIENPNTRSSIGEFKLFSKNDLRKIPTVPNEQELQSSFNAAARAYALNPALFGIMSAISATVNYLKIKNSEEKQFETETQSELENAHEETLKEVSKVSSSDPTKRISTNLR
jgi:hypothetical protein